MQSIDFFEEKSVLLGKSESREKIGFVDRWGKGLFVIVFEKIWLKSV